jgi:hypothetical protein
MLRRLLVPTATTITLLAGTAMLAVVAPQSCAERVAHAKSGMESAYTYEQTWNTALRLVRVDLGYKIIEKDEKAGYILFEYNEKGTASNASIELLPGERTIRVICQIPKFPSYHETVVLDRLARKLKDEHGAPVEKPKPQPDAGPPEAGDAGN